jgi:L-ascorbate metabolism protein UlaG (beta-lactamase superfamily)
MALLYVPQQINMIYCDIIQSKAAMVYWVRSKSCIYIHYDTKNALFCIWDAFDMRYVPRDNQ